MKLSQKVMAELGKIIKESDAELIEYTKKHS